jgi:dolichol-phosphate mannosyltransferase
MTTCAVITTLNEGESIWSLVTTLSKLYNLPVIVVDDGSTDDTVYCAQQAGAEVHVNDERIGIGFSLMLGWQMALDNGADTVFQLDAGGSHMAAEYSQLTNELRDADMVIGSRFMRGGRHIGNLRRAHASTIAARMLNLRYGQSITDWTSGYRAFTADACWALLRCRYRARMHGWQIEVLKHAIDDGLRIREVPITYRAGRSSMNGKIAMEALRQWAY